MSHVGRVLTPPIFNHQRLSQWVARILVFTFITKSMNNKSASFVQKTPTYRAFLHRYVRAEEQSRRKSQTGRSHTVEITQLKSTNEQSGSRNQAIKV